MSETNFYVETSWTWRDRLMFRLFPSKHCDVPMPEDFTAEDVVFVNTTVTLGLMDRLRVLLTGRIAVQTRTATEFKPGKMLTTSVAYVEAGQR